MKLIQRAAFIGNHLPRRCGIATFTHDLHSAVATARPDIETCVVAMTDPGRTYDYPPAVRFQVHDETIGDYVQAAEFLNNAGFDVVSLQHEYGILVVRPAEISSSCYRASKCRLSRHCTRCSPSRRPPNAM